ncbi:hypothetical protein CXB49_09435 [Chromobacterium sp. ATCC 53434]|uniref:type VI secretion system protein TssA n=1 Tax=Chromobacterium sp. (strain ATCC 53434 / SC 14030) TaxID=2059672 RepID=UPI000C766B67|nr:type VI secretion system ImpA family N-terminal domain-containing protein [Chromobacterium sp. ATCC 53434]AUH51018.1 hypothetical protein CXB49_09435 [Chromobacterium sp. ATCC 53434]
MSLKTGGHQGVAVWFLSDFAQDPVMSNAAADFEVAEHSGQEDLDSDADFIRIDAVICEHDAVGQGPLRKGSEPFHWLTVETVSRALLARSADVRVGVWLLRAAVAQRGLAGAAEGLAVLGELATRPAGTIRPIAAHDETAGELHGPHLAWLCGDAFLHQLRHSRLSPASDASVLQLLSNGPAGVSLAEQEGARRALQGMRVDLVRLTRLSEQEAFVEPFDCSRLIALLDDLAAELSTPAPPGGTGPPASAPSDPASAVMLSREDVAAALDSIIAYFREHEPGHPAPIFLLRTKRMLGAGFEDLMAELFAESDALVAKLDRPRPPQ